MTGVNTVVRSLTGPRRLRSALRQKTAPLTRLLVALDGPCELRATIPAAVFGGDIFGVISEQLRAALIVPPTTAPVISRPHRKHSLPSVENSFAKHPQDFFSPLAARITPSKLLALTPTTSFRDSERSSLEPQTSGAFSIKEDLTEHQPPAGSLVPALARLHQSSDVAQQQSIEFAMSGAASPASTSKLAPTAQALVNSLNRYWQNSRETNRSARANESMAVNEQPALSRITTASDVVQPGSSVWPNAIRPDAFKSTASVNERAPFKETTNSVAGRALRSERPTSGPDPDFDFHPANNHAPLYDDLGDRLAQILHEQALQHGIDVT
jgi:hypothetical protein